LSTHWSRFVSVKFTYGWCQLFSKSKRCFTVVYGLPSVCGMARQIWCNPFLPAFVCVHFYYNYIHFRNFTL